MVNQQPLAMCKGLFLFDTGYSCHYNRLGSSFLKNLSCVGDCEGI